MSAHSEKSKRESKAVTFTASRTYLGSAHSATQIDIDQQLPSFFI